MQLDGTITPHGKLSAAAYISLWRLHDSGIHMIPVTDRPAEWCDMFLHKIPMRAVVEEDEESMKSGIPFLGDSPKGEPMFALFSLLASVANIPPFVAQLHYLPSYVTRERSGEGFARAVDHLLELRKD